MTALPIQMVVHMENMQIFQIDSLAIYFSVKIGYWPRGPHGRIHRVGLFAELLAFNSSIIVVAMSSWTSFGVGTILSFTFAFRDGLAAPRAESCTMQ